MDTRYVRVAHHRARGAVRPVAIAIVAIIAVLAAAAWWLIIRPYQQQMQMDAGVPVAPTAAGKGQP